MQERWAEIEEFPNYFVSNTGHISNIKYGRELKPRSNGRGYMKVMLCNDGYEKDLYVHRLVAEHFLEGFRAGVQVAHISDDKTDNDARNLKIRGGRFSGHLYPEKYVHPDRGKVRIIETGQVFINVRACAAYLNGDYGSIYAVLRGERKTHHGYRFEYLERALN